MEQIGKVLQNFRIGIPATPGRHTTPDLTKSRLPIEMVAESLRVDPAHTFANFKKVPGIEPCLRVLGGLLDGPRFIVLIYGGIGNGKTHLLEAVVIELYKKGIVCRRMTFGLMISTLKAAMNNPDHSYDEILNNYCRSPYLIVDDIGAAGSATEFADTILEMIVCYRYERNLFTLMSTNRDIAALPERVQSRLKDKSKCYLIFNEAEDYRPKLEAK